MMDLEDMSTRLSHMREQLDALSDRLTDAAFTGASDDERISVTVNAAGQMTDLTIDPRVFRNPDSEGLAEEILLASRRAIANANEKVAALHKTVFGSERLADGTNDPTAVTNTGRRLASRLDPTQNNGGER